jgi:hypothetical protein
MSKLACSKFKIKWDIGKEDKQRLSRLGLINRFSPMYAKTKPKKERIELCLLRLEYQTPTINMKAPSVLYTHFNKNN